MNAHRQSIRDHKETLVAMHFNGSCSLEHLSVQPIEIISGNGIDEKPTKQRKLRSFLDPRVAYRVSIWT